MPKGRRGVPRTVEDKRAISAGQMRAQAERERAHKEFIENVKEALKLAAPAGPALVTGSAAAILCTTPYRTAKLMAFPLSVTRLLPLVGDAMHGGYEAYLTGLIHDLTGKGPDQLLSTKERLLVGSLVGVATYAAVEFIRQLGGIMKGYGEAIPG